MSNSKGNNNGSNYNNDKDRGSFVLP